MLLKIPLHVKTEMCTQIKNKNQQKKPSQVLFDNKWGNIFIIEIISLPFGTNAVLCFIV